MHFNSRDTVLKGRCVGYELNLFLFSGLLRSAWFGGSSLMSRAVPYQTGSDSSVLPGTVRSKTWRLCQIYLVDR